MSLLSVSDGGTEKPAQRAHTGDEDFQSGSFTQAVVFFFLPNDPLFFLAVIMFCATTSLQLLPVNINLVRRCFVNTSVTYSVCC